MSMNHHLMRRNGTYYYRLRVPAHLVSAVGQEVIQHSLKTTDPKEARRLRTQADAVWEERFRKLERELEPQSAESIGRDETDLVRDYVEGSFKSFLDSRAMDNPDSPEQLAEMKAETETALTALKTPGDPYRDEWVALLTDKLATTSSSSITNNTPGTARLAELARRALIELFRRKLAVYEDRYDKMTFDHLFSVAQPVSMNFGKLAERFLEERLEDARVNRRAQKTMDKIESNVDLIRVIIGDKTPVAEIGHETVQRLRSTLARTPTHRLKLYKGMSLEKAIAKAEKEKKPVLSATTQAQYLEIFRSMMDLAVRMRLIPSSPAHGVKPIKREKVRAKDRRLPLTLDQIAKLFKSDFYLACSPHAAKPYAKQDRAWRFWLPLLCLFMGLRPNEACQMFVGDVKQTPSGTWYLDIAVSDDDDDASNSVEKSLKTEYSRRRVPVHPELLELGFLDFVALRRDEDPTGRLLPGLKPDKYGNLATYPLKRFRDVFLPAAIELQPRQSFYSLRHSFRDALRRAEVPADTLQALGGWAQGARVSDDYGSVDDPDFQAKHIAKVGFPGLGWGA